jgi:hypothetical protein
MPVSNPAPSGVSADINQFVKLANGISIKATVTTVDGVKVWKLFFKDTTNEEHEVLSTN